MANKIFDIQKDTASLTNIGKVRKQNQDNIGFAETRNGDIFVVCDGMGGHKGGQIASNIAVDSIVEYFSAKSYADIPEAIDSAVRYANKNIYQKAQEDPELDRMGTTAVVLLVREDKVYFGYVGDSRIYIMSSGKLYRLTKDHSYVQKLIDNGIITEEKAETHPKKSQLLKALGIAETVEPEVCNEPVLPKNGDKFLLCSDGLTGPVNDLNIQSILKTKAKNANEKANELLSMALAAGGSDNISIQIVEITNSNYKESKFTDRSNKDLLTTSQIETAHDSDNMSTNADIDNPQLNTTLDNTNPKHKESGNRKFSLIDFLKSRNGIISVFIIILLIVLLYFLFSKETEKDYALYLKAEASNAEELIDYFSDQKTARQKASECIDEFKDDKKQIHSLIIKNKDSVIWDTVFTAIKEEKKNEYEKYVIKEGDTWKTIWEEYKVCSIYIIEDEKNRDIFPNQDENSKPIAGKTIHIPLSNSGDSTLNPEYWEHYTLSKVGKNCGDAKGNNNPRPSAPSNNKKTATNTETPDTETPKTETSEDETLGDTESGESENPVEQSEETTTNREIKYTVEAGVGWLNIYRKFGVCPNYIKDQNDLGINDNPENGQVLVIPLDKSCKKKYNPNNYENFPDNFGKCKQN